MKEYPFLPVVHWYHFRPFDDDDIREQPRAGVVAHARPQFQPLDRVAEGGIPRMGKARVELARWLPATAPRTGKAALPPPREGGSGMEGGPEDG